MRVLALFSNDDGEARQAVVSLTLAGIPYELGLTDSAFDPERIREQLEDYNDDGSLFLVALDADGTRPDVVDGAGTEISCAFFEVELG